MTTPDQQQPDNKPALAQNDNQTDPKPENNAEAPNLEGDLPDPKREDDLHPLAAWFLGPKAEQAEVWQNTLSYIFQDYVHWRRNYFPEDPITISRIRRRTHEAWFDGLNSRLDWLLGELKAHYPFYSPRYVAHMLSEQTLPSVLGYFAGMLYNPNNVTDEAAPVTVELELEVGKLIAEMVGYNRNRAWAHICSGGTTANLEALWVARTAQFTPLTVQEYCIENNIGFEIKVPDGRQVDVKDLSPRELLSLIPNESIFMLRKLARVLIHDRGGSREEVIEGLTAGVRNSSYNPKRRGIASILRQVDMTPKIFVSAAAHYSIKKAANVLGYGEDAVSLVPVTERFRLNVDQLGERIASMTNNEYIAAVVGIVGTTEEGAVDPIHRIRFLQQDLSRNANRSFWLHVDAAWGGYIRSLFCGHAFPDRQQNQSLKEICGEYAKRIAAVEEVSIGAAGAGSTREIKWNDSEVYSAFLAMPDADSITIDPHKLGYVPYPSGVIAFRNGLVTELVTQEAQYISDEREGIRSIDEPMAIKGVGPYVLEGSKPGAAAAACWLAHTAIPLTIHGHGQIIRSSLLKARKLTRYLVHHRHMFRTVDAEFFGSEARCNNPFTFVPLYDPDTNVICFVTVPMSWQKNALVAMDVPLTVLNDINAQMYEELTLPKAQASTTSSDSRRSRLPYGQPYFVSRTRFEERQYSARSLKCVLERLGIVPKDYSKMGLFVLRSAIMNPLYQAAEDEGKDHLLDFVKHLHRLARAIVRKNL